MSYEIAYRIVPKDAVNGALRLIHNEILTNGVTTEQLGHWAHHASWFWTLRYEPAILALASHLPDEWKGDYICDPQILLHFPDAPDKKREQLHLDSLPEWAAEQGKRYTSIVGVPLSPWSSETGGLVLPSELLGNEYSPHVNPGDAIRMTGDQPHSGGINRTGSIRYGVYFRWVS